MASGPSGASSEAVGTPEESGFVIAALYGFRISNSIASTEALNLLAPSFFRKIGEITPI